MTKVILRPYQDRAVEMLREGIRAGYRKQILMSPTGSGKTEIGCFMLQEAQRKGARALFIVDRVVLVDQTSDRLDQYGISHGVIQSGHWRFRTYENIQVCSAQTIERRGIPDDVSVIFVDEAHCLRKKIVEHLQQTDAIVIGLSATPFTKGLASVYSNLVNVITMNELIEQKYLVPLKMYAAKSINVEGMKIVAGEWSEKDIQTRGLEIVGDIIAEWKSKTELHFGGPVKTIVFSATVDHGAELCRQFQAAGFNFHQISYKDGGDEHRRALIAEFRRPDSEIHGLISCEVFTKGFDVPDVLCGVSARPYRKSLSSHIQQMGRVMRSAPGKDFGLWLDHCIASGSMVLTQRGLVAIEKILLSDTLWDGETFVAHRGVVSRGIRPVITYAGLTATADHPVKTAKGWRTLGSCAEEQTPIVATGFGRQEVRERDNYFTRRSLAWREDSPIHACAMRVRYLWLQVHNFLQQLDRSSHEWVQGVQSAEAVSRLALSACSRDEATLPEQEGCRISELRRPGDSVPFRWCDFWMSVDSGQSRYSRAAQDAAFGSHRQRRELRAGKYSLVHLLVQSIAHAARWALCKLPSLQNCASRDPIFGSDNLHNDRSGIDRRADHRAVSQAVEKTEREVWDILDCGPRNCFTCQGLLVHNSGNALRFMEDTSDIFQSGCSTLDDGIREEKARKEPTEKERAEIRCSCGYILMAYEKVCPSCGKERRKTTTVEAVPGQLFELEMGKRANKVTGWPEKAAFYAGLKSYASERGYKPGYAANQYRMKFGVWPNDPRVHHVEPGPVTPEIVSWIKSRQIAYAKARRVA